MESATVYIERQYQAYPFSEYSPCFAIKEASRFFSADVGQSRFCNPEEFETIMAGWKNENSAGGTGLSPAVIAGISIGSVLVIATVVTIIICLVKRWRPLPLSQRSLEPQSTLNGLYPNDAWV
jgi:hypothetical protein